MAALVTAALPFAGCLDLKVVPDACSVSIAPGAVSVPVNSTYRLTGTAFDCEGNSIRNKKILYSSSNNSVATVTSEGGVIGVAVGAASITATSDGKSSSSQVTVTAEAAANIVVSPGALILRRTNTRQLTATARNSTGAVVTGRTIRWSSSNSAIASIDQNGLITAIAAGTVVVNAEIDQTVGSATVVVTEIPIGSCSLSPASTKLTVSQSVQPTLALRDTANNPLSVQGRAFSWTSSNEVVATVSLTGIVTTRKAGVTNITATSAENTAISCTTTIQAVDPRIAQLVVTPLTGQLRVGVPRVFTATLLDSTNAQIPGGRIVTWSTNTPTIVSVTQAGVATGLALGTARIIATSEGIADTVTLAVTKVPVGTVTTSPLQVSLFEGQTVQLRATVTDSVGTEVTDRPVEWLSSDPTRVTVSNKGLVTALAAGAANIIATTENRVGQTSVSVQQVPVDSIEVERAFTVPVGTTGAFAITLRDINGNEARNRSLLVTSSTPGVAVGQANASSTLVTVSGLAVGTTRLTLQALDGNNRSQGKPSTVTVTVAATLVPVDTIEVARTFSLTVGTASAFAIKVRDTGGNEVRNRNILVTSSAPSVVIGQANGTSTLISVNGLTTGTARLTIQALDANDRREGKPSYVDVTVTAAVAPVDTIIVDRTFSVTVGTTSAFAISVRDGSGNEVRNRNILVTSSVPGVVIGQANSTSTLVSVSGLSTGTARLTLQALDANDRNQGKPSYVDVTVTSALAPVDTILVERTFSLAVGATSAFAITARDVNGNEARSRNILVTSSAPSIVVGQANSTSTLITVSGFAAGTARLTIQAIDANDRNQGKPSYVDVTVTAGRIMIRSVPPIE